MGENAGMTLSEELNSERSASANASPWFKAFVCLSLVLLSPVLFLWAILYLLWGAILYIAVWISWCARGRDVLFVFSNSPIWHDYIQQEILSYLGKRAIVLNWSERKQWNPSLAILVFRYFSNHRDFNPLALVFRPFRFVKTFRFYKPFKDNKRGDLASVEKIKNELFESLAIQQ
jgi:hypothetical protein